MNDLTLIEREYGDLSRYRQCPTGWLAMPEQAAPFLDSLKTGSVRTIGRSVAGREILAIEYGPKEPLDDVTSENLSSSLAGKLVPPDPTDIYPPSFFGSNRRRRPVVVLQGGIHGGELTGTVASLNLCQIIETGNDLRGKAWPRLAELARATRIGVIPWLNPDATARWPLWNSEGAPHALYSLCTQGVRKDGTPYRYPAVKKIFPIPTDDAGFLGTYYNDAGVNLQYDFTSVERQPETTAWMRYYLDEKPDGVIIWHCNAGSLMGPPSSYLPEGYQHTISRVAGAVKRRLRAAGFTDRAGEMSWSTLPGLGKPYMEQMAATYHVCGTLPLMVELPVGTIEYPMTADEMIDMGLLLIEEILAFAHSDGLRPYELWDKVKRQLQKQSAE